jgi:hypothetical protein
MRLLALGAAVLVLSACGGSHATSTTTPAAKPASFAGTVARTTAAQTVRFAQLTQLSLSGSILEAAENGTASLVKRRAHVYKQLAGGGVPGEIVVVGPITYTNANVQASLNDPAVPPWTKLDTRRLSARQRASQADELAHAVAPAYLAAGVSQPRLVGIFGNLTEYRGSIDPTRLADQVPRAVRSSVLKAVGADYPAHAFPARFWLDPQGRIRRVLVAYSTPKGTPVVVDTRYQAFGVKVDVSLPPAREIKDVTPAS